MNTNIGQNSSLQLRRIVSVLAAGAAALVLFAACGCGNSNVGKKEEVTGKTENKLSEKGNSKVEETHADGKRDAVNSPEEARLKLAQLSVDYSPANFVLYAWKGDTTVIKLFFEAGIDVNSGIPDHGFRSTLLQAVEERDYSATDSFNDFGPVTALEAALLGGHREAAIMLLNHKAKVGRESIAAAAFLGDAKLLSAEVAAWKTQPEAAKFRWAQTSTTGLAAMSSPKPQAVGTLLDVGYNASFMLHLAVLHYQPGAVELLLRQGGLGTNQMQDGIADAEEMLNLARDEEKTNALRVFELLKNTKGN